MNFIKGLALLVILGFGCNSCRIKTEEGSIVDTGLKSLMSEDQQSREDIILAFANDPAMAIAKYKEIWTNAQASKSKEFISENSTVLLAIAGEMMAVDKQSYDEYNTYVKSAFISSDEEILVSALWALSKSSDRESVGILFEYSNNKTDAIEDAALGSLEYMYKSTTFDLSTSGFYKEMQEQFFLNCGSSKANEKLINLCEKLQINSTATQRR